MKWMHLGDLHIGKRVNEFSMLEDQRYILRQILTIAADEQAEGILIAGDVYDKSQPSTEAVELFDEFLTQLAQMKLPVFLISGNHDSPERLNFASKLLVKNGLYIAGVFEGGLKKVELSDAHGPLNIYMLPFVKPPAVRPYFEEEIETYDQAVKAVIDHAPIDTTQRNILMAHQFVIGGGSDPLRSESEVISVGGVDQVFAGNFDVFDYVALGHLHAPQKVGREEVRYSGSPLKYSASEISQKKSVTFIEMGPKGSVEVYQIPLQPLRDMREMKGPLAALLEAGRLELSGSEDYIHAILTDLDDPYDAMGQLRLVYPNTMSLVFQKYKDLTETTLLAPRDEELKEKTMMELFADFYTVQNQEVLSEEEIKLMEQLIEEVGGLNI